MQKSIDPLNSLLNKDFNQIMAGGFEPETNSPGNQLNN
jgi:hypothetical protein